jgi:EmrB/QacA subfamily drug resistance transporter
MASSHPYDFIVPSPKAELASNGGSPVSPPTFDQPQLSHREILVVFAALMLGMLLAALDQTVLATAMPTIVGELGGLNKLSWIITAYLLASTASIPIYGKLGDMYGRKILLQFAIACFVLGSVAAGASQDINQMIGARVIQGLGAGGLMSTSQAVIADILAPRERGRYIGYLASVFAFSSVAGPLIGGFFTDGPGWRWVFYINLPLGLLAFAVTTKFLKLRVNRVRHSVDYVGAAMMIVGVSAILLATSWGGNEHAWGSPTIVGLFGGGAALMVAFVLWETRAAEPILPLSLFKDPTFRICSVLGMLVAMGLFGVIAFIPVFLQVAEGVSATESGLRTTPMMVGIVTTAIFSGQMISRTGNYRLYPIFGTLTVAAGLFALSRLTESADLVLISLCLFALGTGVGLVMQVTLLAVQNAVDFQHMGTATGGVTFFRTMGGAFGVAIFGSILNNRLDHNLPRLVPESSLNGIDSNTLVSSPEQLLALPPAVLEGVRQAFSESLGTVFLLAVPLALAAFVLSLFLPNIALRERSVGSMRPGGPPRGAEGEETAPVVAEV